MASAALRRYVMGLLEASPVLTTLGYGPGHISPTFGSDGPYPIKFCIINWGTTVRGIGRVNRPGVAMWFYNKDPDFEPIVNAIKECKVLMEGMIGMRIPGTTDEAVVDVAWEGDSGDLFDDGYKAQVRWSQFTITASGS